MLSRRINRLSIITAWLNGLAGEMTIRTFGRVAAVALLIMVGPVANALPENFVVETVIPALTKPTATVTMPDGNMLVTEQTGFVKIFDPSTIPAGTTTILTLSAVDSVNERGVVSIVLDPDFARNGHFYLYYTHSGNGNRNRVSRFTLTGGTSSQASEILVWEDNEPAMSCCHFGGGMDFGPDGMLYVTTGDEFDVGNGAEIPAQAQDLTRAGGKILRLNVANVDASGPWVRGEVNAHIIPADNPDFADAPAEALGEVWALGLRNPFRAHWDIPGKRFFIGEVGGNRQDTAREDLHIGVAGANYGWPFCNGQCANSAYEDPIYDYGHMSATPNGGAIAAGVMYRDNTYPSIYNGAFFFSDYVLGYIKYLTFNVNGSVASVNEFATEAGSPAGMEVGPDGALYVIDYGGTRVGAGKLIRYTYNSGNQPPEILSASATYTPGAEPLSVDFSVTAADPDNSVSELTYEWSFGDGSPDESGQSVQHEYDSAGTFSAFVRVSDPQLTTNSEQIEIQVGIPPIVSIDSPQDGSTFRAGDTIEYSGSVVNAALSPPYSYQWNIDFFHNAHIHPGPNSTSASDSFFIETSGHDYLDSTGYVLKLTVTDSRGLSATEEVTITPEKVTMNLSTVPGGHRVFVDGLAVETNEIGGTDYDTVINFDHVLSVQEIICDSGEEHVFDNWSGFSAGDPRTHPLTVPATDFDLVANYQPTGQICGNGVGVQTGLVAYYEADVGVTTTANNVVIGWNDQSGQGNDLAVLGDPVLVTGVLNGKPVVDFDSVEDAMQRLVPSGLPTGNADRTVYLVANYRGGELGGFAYGAPSGNQGFGLIADETGRLTVQGFGLINDYSIGDDVRNNWLVQSVVLTEDQVTHYRDGVQIDMQSHVYDTGSDLLMVGAELSGRLAPMDMQVAAVLVYDRALSKSEQSVVQTYLQEKYFNAITNRPPFAANDSCIMFTMDSVTISVLNNDSDTDGDLDPSTVTIATNGTFGTATPNDDGTITYVHTGGGEIDQFEYTVSDSMGLTSNTGVVTVTIVQRDPPSTTVASVDPDITSADQSSNGNAGSSAAQGDIAGGDPALDSESTAQRVSVQNGIVAYFESDRGVVSSGDIVGGWNDQSGRGNHLSARGDPLLVNGALNGHAVIDFDGVRDSLEKLLPQGLPAGAADRTIFLMANYRGGAFGGVAFGAASASGAFGLVVDGFGRQTVQGYAPINDFATGADIRNNWVVQSVVVRDNQMSHYRDGVLRDTESHVFATGSEILMIGAELSDERAPMDMQIAAVLVYNRALSAAEQADVQEYLQSKYLGGTVDLAPAAEPDAGTVTAGGSVSINVAGNDTDSNGNLDPATVTIISNGSAGTVVANGDGTVTYMHTGAGNADTFEYTVSDTTGLVSNSSRVAISISSDPSLP